MLNTVTLPNGLKVANVTPHAITFWTPEWSEPVEVTPSGKIINAKPNEVRVGGICDGSCGMPRGKALEECGCGQPESATLVETTFTTSPDAEEILGWCESHQAVPVGSIIAAQAYPGRVVAMTPAKGYERVAVPLPTPVQDAINVVLAGFDSALSLTNSWYSDEEVAATNTLRNVMAAPTKRMNPSKFTIFSAPLTDGVYAVKNGMFTQVDVFTWGYEGDAPVAQSRVLRDKATGQTALCYGPGVNHPESGYEIIM